MIKLTLTEIVRRPSILKENLEKGKVRIVWHENKPNGKEVYSAIVEKEEVRNVR